MLTCVSFRRTTTGRGKCLLWLKSGHRAASETADVDARVVAGDKVIVESTAYDPDRGRIIYRFR